MNSHPALEVFANWLLNQSLRTGVLVLAVLFVQWIFRKQLTARWRFALWWLVLLQLIVPVRPQSSFSLFNWLPSDVNLLGARASDAVDDGPPSTSLFSSKLARDTGAAVSESAEPGATRLRGTLAEPIEPAALPNLPQSTQVGTPPQPPIVPNLSHFRDGMLTQGLLALWLAGVLGLSGCVLVQIVRFRRRLAPSVTIVEQPVQHLLQCCRRELGIRRRVELLETEAVRGPALFGLLRLRLLLPTGLNRQFDRDELRFIFLHELAHVKRGDLWINWFVTALQIMHWFNPLLWLGFARLRADRELACDELALLHAGENAGISYGQTIIKLLEGFNGPAAIPGLVGIVEDTRQMQRRIRMIARFKKPSRWSALALVLVLGLGVAGLTNGRTQTGRNEIGPNADKAAALSRTADKLAVPGKPEAVALAEAAQPSASSTQTVPSSGATGPDLSGKVVNANGKPSGDAKLITGIVISPDGRPMPKCNVSFVHVGYLSLRPMHFVPFGEKEGITTISDVEGRFHFNPHPLAHRIVAVHEQGYAEVSADSLTLNPEVRLRPWGRIEGILRAGDAPASGGEVRLASTYDSLKPTFDPQDFTRSTDEAGHFSFERVPPGKLWMVQLVNVPGGRHYYGQGSAIEVEPGRTTRITMGGHGLTVTGRVSVEVKPAPMSLEYVMGSLHWPMPDGRFASWAAYQAWSDSVNLQRRATYAFGVQTDGSFQVPDVQPGSYLLEINLLSLKHRQLKEHVTIPVENILASLQREVEIPAQAANSSYDFGRLQLQPFPELRPGDPAPALEFETLAGQRRKLSDYQGRPILLCFWSGYSDEDPKPYEPLRDVARRYAGDQLWIIGVSKFGTAKGGEEFTQKTGMRWLQGLLTEHWMERSQIMRRFQLKAPLDVLLIGPDGKIVARDLEGESIKATVEKALVAK